MGLLSRLFGRVQKEKKDPRAEVDNLVKGYYEDPNKFHFLAGEGLRNPYAANKCKEIVRSIKPSELESLAQNLRHPEDIDAFGWFTDDLEFALKVTELVLKYQPKIMDCLNVDVHNENEEIVYNVVNRVMDYIEEKLKRGETDFDERRLFLYKNFDDTLHVRAELSPEKLKKVKERAERLISFYEEITN